MAKLEVVISDEIATLCSWAEHNLHLSFIDAIFAQNQLLDLFLQSTPGIARPVENLSLQKDILDPMLAYARKHKLSTKEDTILFETRVMGLVTPAQSTVLATFDAKAATDGIEEAEDYLNSLAVNSNYIRRVDIAKNVKWQVLNARGDLVITINLSKPEKTNKQVLQEFTKTEVNYPRCALCLENLGFAGDQMRAARQTLRVIPISLCGEEWFFQFSPYVYFDHHSIVFSKEHVPMKITPDTFVRQFDFLELFPNYFIGSNADLPIVGGSILSHDHFQCGKKVLPMFSRAARGAYRHQDFNDVAVYVLDWYNSVVVLKSKNRQSIEKLAAIILSEWRNYSDPQSNILAWTDGKPHNTVTPIATLDDNGIYSLYMILRNNRTDEKHPYGIFHPTEDMHNIKMEGIGLIEAMGVFILPGRLHSEIEEIAKILASGISPDFKDIMDNPQLVKHAGMIAQLSNDCKRKQTLESAKIVIRNYINAVCIKILDCTAVFKNTDEGFASFNKFLASLRIR